MNLFLKSSLHKRPKKSTVAVYIGPEAVEIVYMKKGAIIKSASKEILKKDVTSNTIKELFQSEGIKETSVTTTIPEESVMLRRFTMPVIPLRDRPTAVRFEAKRHIPFNIDEVISNFYITREDPARNQMEILFAAVKKEEINSTILLLKGAGLTIESIEPVSLALIKALITTGNLEEASPPIAVLHFSSKTDAQIVIVENGIPYLQREISLLGKDTKTEEQIINEIRLSSSYYKREFPEKNISRIIICGLKDKPGWVTAVKNEINIPIEYELPFKNITGIELTNLQLEIPIGLASLRLERPKIELNLLPEELAPVRYDIKKWITIEIPIAICILGLIYISQLPSLARLKNDVAMAQKTKAALPELDLSGKSQDELNILKAALQDKRNLLLTYTKNRIKWQGKLKRLIQLMPGETWITELTIEDSIEKPGSKLLTLRGSTYTVEPSKEIEITNNFSRQLKDDPDFMEGFKKLTLGTINKAAIEKYEVVNFDITAAAD